MKAEIQGDRFCAEWVVFSCERSPRQFAESGCPKQAQGLRIKPWVRREDLTLSAERNICSLATTWLTTFDSAHLIFVFEGRTRRWHLRGHWQISPRPWRTTIHVVHVLKLAYFKWSHTHIVGEIIKERLVKDLQKNKLCDTAKQNWSQLLFLVQFCQWIFGKLVRCKWDTGIPSSSSAQSSSDGGTRVARSRQLYIYILYNVRQ